MGGSQVYVADTHGWPNTPRSERRRLAREGVARTFVRTLLPSR